MATSPVESKWQTCHCHKINFWFSLALWHHIPSDVIHDYLSPPLCLLPVLCLFSFPPSFQCVCPDRWLPHSPQAHYCVIWIGRAQLIVTLWERYERRKGISSVRCSWWKERCDSSKTKLVGGSLLPASLNLVSKLPNEITESSSMELNLSFV